MVPEKPGAIIFPAGIDIEEKLEQLEDRKRTLWFLCPERLRESYVYGKDPKLVSMNLFSITGYWSLLEYMSVQCKLRTITAVILTTISLKTTRY